MLRSLEKAVDALFEALGWYLGRISTDHFLLKNQNSDFCQFRGSSFSSPERQFGTFGAEFESSWSALLAGKILAHLLWWASRYSLLKSDKIVLLGISTGKNGLGIKMARESNFGNQTRGWSVSWVIFDAEFIFINHFGLWEAVVGLSCVIFERIWDVSRSK